MLNIYQGLTLPLQPRGAFCHGFCFMPTQNAFAISLRKTGTLQKAPTQQKNHAKKQGASQFI
jgi:hypothetical protein